MKIAIILGTRPEIIKLSPIIRECQTQNADFYILHTGQHYSFNLDRIFFDNLDLPYPKYNLEVGSGSHAEQTGNMLIGIEKYLKKQNPDVILIQGDTNTVLAGGIAAAKLGIKIGHVEAGLRSFDRTMPEEINRVLTDHISHFLFAPTDIARCNLEAEGIKSNNIFVTGNTIVDAIYQNLKIAKDNSRILSELGINPGEYCIVTAHRQENVDNINRLKNIIAGLETVFKEFEIPLIFPIHPRTQNRIKEFSIYMPEGIQIVDPIGYLDFLFLESNARLIFTDSGGVQEEACILNVPCVTLRDNTERPETVDVGCNILAGAEKNSILESAVNMMNLREKWDNPFGDGKSAEKIVKIIEESI